ncbi:hypothetical protein D3C86_1581890 [compost metagenome]
MNLFVFETELEMPCEIVCRAVAWRIPVLHVSGAFTADTYGANHRLYAQRLCQCDVVTVREGLETDLH